MSHKARWNSLIFCLKRVVWVSQSIFRYEQMSSVEIRPKIIINYRFIGSKSPSFCPICLSIKYYILLLSKFNCYPTQNYAQFIIQTILIGVINLFHHHYYVLLLSRERLCVATIYIVFSMVDALFCVLLVVVVVM